MVEPWFHHHGSTMVFIGRVLVQCMYTQCGLVENLLVGDYTLTLKVTEPDRSA